MLESLGALVEDEPVVAREGATQAAGAGDPAANDPPLEAAAARQVTGRAA